MASAPRSEAYAFYISYYRTATPEQLEGLRERTRRAAAELADVCGPDVQEWAAGKIAAIDKLMEKHRPKPARQSGPAQPEQIHF